MWFTPNRSQEGCDMPDIGFLGLGVLSFVVLYGLMELLRKV
jgi:hypothetical protein